jgi:predicted Zn-dependent protease
MSEIVPQLSLALVPEGKSANFLQALTEVVRDKKWGIGNSNVNFDWEKVAGLTKDEAAKRKTETTEQQVGTKKVATATYDPTTKTTTVKQPPAKTEVKVEITEEDKQALEWANANPNDKRAKAIKDKLKQKSIQ